MRPAPSGRVSGLEWTALLLVVLFFVGTFQADGGFHFSREASDYYGFLTDALCSGQAHLKIEPDPRLAQLPNPWVGYVGIPRLHDATYYHGHYYLYFGVAPVVLLMAPWHLIFGTFFAEAQATAVFGLVGTLAGLLILRRWALLLGIGPRWRAVGVLLWGVCSGALYVSQEPTFYFTAILCGVMCRLLAFSLITRAVTSSSVRGAVAAMAGASFFWGMSVASRPHFVFSLPILLIPLAWLFGRSKAFAGIRERIQLSLATLVPAGLVGSSLAWYNYIRFGKLSEFGFTYQFTIVDQRSMKMWNPDRLPHTLHEYLTSGAHGSLYFPFAIPREGMPGVFAWSPLAVLALAFPALLVFSPRLRALPAWVCTGAAALSAAGITTFVLCVQVFYSARYEADFWPEFLLVAMGVAMAWLSASPGILRRIGSYAVGLGSAISLFLCSCLVLQAAHSESLRHKAASLLNGPIGHLQTAADSIRGPYKLDLSFDELEAGRDTPLLETGVGHDAVFVRRDGDDSVRIGFEHKGNAALLGEPVALKHGYHQTVTIDVGSVYPPTQHPFFSGWNREAVDLLHQRVRVTVDGQLALDAHSEFYWSDPLHEYVALDVTGFKDNSHPVKVYRMSRLRVPQANDVLADGWRGPVRLRLKFPAFKGVILSEPLMSSGSHGASDMIYVTYHAPGKVSFSHDASNFGAAHSEILSIDPLAEHTLDIDYGALDAPDSPALGLNLRFDGTWILHAPRPSHPTKPGEVSFGFNSGTLSTANESFSGPELRPEHLDSFGPGAVHADGHGPLEIQLQVEPMPKGTVEPLVTLGVPGAADIIFARFLGTSEVVIGLDHWGTGVAESAPLPVPAHSLHTLRVESSGLAPTRPAGIRVLWDGRVAVDAPSWKGFPASEGTISWGRNPAGGSTTNVPVFAGTVLEAHRALP